MDPNALGTNRFTPATLAASARAFWESDVKGMMQLMTTSCPVSALTSSSCGDSSSKGTIATPWPLTLSTSGLLIEAGRT